MIEVLLFGTSKLFLKPLEKLINNEPNMNVSRICYQELDVFKELEKNLPDVVIIYHQDTIYETLVQLLKTEFEGIHVIRLSNENNKNISSGILKSKLNNYLGDKNPNPEKLIQSINSFNI